jgi:hypothetical protein
MISKKGKHQFVTVKPGFRPCLGWCERYFFSTGPGERYCQKCRAHKESLSLSRAEARTIFQPNDQN